LSEQVIADIETANRKVRTASKALSDFLAVVKSPAWQAFDTDLAQAKQVYNFLKTQMAAEVAALPEV
jgi:stress-induced morphogen